MGTSLRILFSAVTISLALRATAIAQPSSPAPAPAPAAQPQVVDLSKVNRRAWAGAQQPGGNEIEVVQNRKYSNAERLELGLLGGLSVSDPFLSVKQYGGSIGYHFNNFYSLHLIYWKYSVSPSAASESFFQLSGSYAAVNEPQSFLGGQFVGNFLYGKLSLLGKMIIYIDVFALAGAGIQKNANGSALAPFLGIGQMIHLDRHLALKLDYRILRYGEKVEGPSGPISRTNVTEAVNLGLSYFF